MDSTWDSDPEKKQDKEIHRKITARWTRLAKHRDIFKGNIGRGLNREVFDSCSS